MRLVLRIVKPAGAVRFRQRDLRELLSAWIRSRAAKGESGFSMLGAKADYTLFGDVEIIVFTRLSGDELRYTLASLRAYIIKYAWRR